MAARENGGQDCSGPVNKEPATGLEPEVTNTVTVHSNTKLDGTKSNAPGSPQNQEQQDDSNASVTVKGEEVLQHNVGKKAHANTDFSQTGEMSADQNKMEHINNQKVVVKSTGKQEDETEPKKVSETPLESQTDMNPDASNENSMGYVVISDSKVALKVEGKDRSKQIDTEEGVHTSSATEGEGHSPEVKIKDKHLNQLECSNDVVEDSAVNEEPNEVDPHPNQPTRFSSKEESLQEQESEDTKNPTKHVTSNTINTTDSKQVLNSDHGMPGAGQLVPPPSSDSLQKSVEWQDGKVVGLGAEVTMSEQLSEVEVTSEPKQPLTASATDDDSRLENDDPSNDRNDYKELSNNYENFSLESKEQSFVVLNESISETQNLGNCEMLYCRESSADKDLATGTNLPSIKSSGSHSFIFLSMSSGSYNEDIHLDTDHQQVLPLDIEERKAENIKGSQMETKQPSNIYDDSLEKEKNILHTDSNAIQRDVGKKIGKGNITESTDEAEEAEAKSLELGFDSGLDSLLDAGARNKAESGHIEKEEYPSSKNIDKQDMQIGNMDNEQNGTSSGLNLDSLDFDQGSLGNIDESIEIINGSTSQQETNTTEYDEEKKREIQSSTGNTESFTSTGLPSTSGRRSDSFSIISLPANDTDHEPEFEQTQPLITSSDDQEKDQRYDKTGEADETRSDIEGEQSPFDNGKSSSGNSNSECKTEHQGSSILQTDTEFNETETSLEDDKEIFDDEKHKDQRPLTGEEDQAAPDVNGEPSSMQSFEVVDNVVSSTEISSQHQNETVDVPESPRTSAEQNLQISKFFDTMSNKRDGDEEPENTGRSSVEEVRNLGQTEDERNKTQTDQPGNSLDSDDDAEEENDNEDPQGFVDDSGAGKRDSVASDSSGRAEDELPERDPNKCFRQKGNDKVNTPEGDNRQSGQSMMDLVQGNVKDDVNTNLETDLNGAATDGTQDDFTGNENEGDSSNYLHTEQLELQNCIQMDISETKITPAINQDRNKEEMEDIIAEDCVASQGKENTDQKSVRVDILPGNEDHNQLAHKERETKSTNVSLSTQEWSLISTSERNSKYVGDLDTDSMERELYETDVKVQAVYSKEETDISDQELFGPSDGTPPPRISPQLDESEEVTSTEDGSQYKTEVEDATEPQRFTALHKQDHQISKFNYTINSEKGGDEIPEKTDRLSLEKVENPSQTIEPPDVDERIKIQAKQLSDNFDSNYESEENGNKTTEDPPGFVDDKNANRRDSVVSDSSDKAELLGLSDGTSRPNFSPVLVASEEVTYKSGLKHVEVTEILKKLDDVEDDDNSKINETSDLNVLCIVEEGDVDTVGLNGGGSRHTVEEMTVPSSSLDELSAVKTGQQQTAANEDQVLLEKDDSSLQDDIAKDMHQEPGGEEDLSMLLQNMSLTDPKIDDRETEGDKVSSEGYKTEVIHTNKETTYAGSVASKPGNISPQPETTRDEISNGKQVEKTKLHPGDKLQQTEQSSADSYEMPPVSDIYLLRVWSEVQKEGNPHDVVKITLTYQQQMRWKVLFSNHAAFELLKSDLDQNKTALIKSEEPGIFMSVVHLCHEFQKLDQVSLWWKESMAIIKNHLEKVKVFTCRWKVLERKSIIPLIEKLDAVRNEQVMVDESDISSKKLSLVGPSEEVKAIICHLWKALGDFEVNEDENQLSITHFTTTVENAQLMQMFHLPDIIKHQKDVDLLIEKNELYIIGALKPDEDTKKILKTDDWMYQYLQCSVLVDKPLLEMLRNEDNLHYVEKQIKSQRKVFHMIPSEEHLVLFAESKKTAEHLMQMLINCFKKCTFDFLKEPDPMKGLQNILQMHKDHLHTEIIQKEYALAVTIFARDDKFKIICEAIENLSSQLDKQLQKDTTSTKEVALDSHFYHFLKTHVKEAFENVKLSENENGNVLLLTGTDSAIENCCRKISAACQDLQTRQCIIETHRAVPSKEFIGDLENEHCCCIESQTVENDAAASAEKETKVKKKQPHSKHLAPEESWDYNGTIISIVTCDLQQADDIDVVVNPDARRRACSIDVEKAQESKGSTILSFGIPNYTAEVGKTGKAKTTLQSAFEALMKFVRNRWQKCTFGIPVHGICNWDFKKFVKCLLCSIKGQVPKVVLYVPNESVKKEVARIIVEARGYPFTINVKLGDITKEKVDVIVNTTSKDVELNIGTVSRAILTAAGSNIQKQCSDRRQRFGNELPPGEIIVTDGFRLECHGVIHGALQEWSQNDTYSQQKNISNLEKFIYNCLQEALEKKWKSISFPVLGTGNLQYPTDLVAEVMLKEMKAFGNNHPEGTLKVINIVVYEADIETYQIFLHKFKEIVGPLPESSVDPCPTGLVLRIGDYDLEIAMGDVKMARNYETLVLIWTQEDMINPSSGAMKILQVADEEILQQWPGLDLKQEKKFVIPGGNLDQVNIVNVYADKEHLVESFITGISSVEASGLCSLALSFGQNDALSKDVDSYAQALYQALKTHKSIASPQLRIKVCVQSQELCKALQHALASLNYNEGTLSADHKGSTATEAKEKKPSPLKKILYKITGKKQDTEIVKRVLTDGVIEETEKVDDVHNFDVKEERTAKLAALPEKTVENEEMYNKEAEEKHDEKKDNLQDSSRDSRDFVDSLSHDQRYSTHLDATDDAKHCVVAESSSHFDDEMENVLKKTLEKNHKPVAVLCPYNTQNLDKVLIVYDSEVDASSVLKDMEIRRKMQMHEINLGPFPPQVIVNLKASFDITKLMLIGNRTLQPDIVERSLIESTGVKIEKSLREWNLKGTLPQLQKAKEYLRGLVVEMAKQQEEKINVSVSKEDSSTTKVTVQNVTQAVYCAYLFFNSKSHDKDNIPFLRYDSRQNLAEIEGTFSETQKIKSALERILKHCECLPLNISTKKLSVADLREKLHPIKEKQSQVYIHIHEKKDVSIVDEISFLGFVKESVQQVKSLVFEKLGLATNRRNRFDMSAGAKPKDFPSPQNSIRMGSTDQDSLFGSPTSEETSRRVFQKTSDRSHFKAGDKFPVYVYLGDILYLDVDCIVNAANSELDHGGGVAGAISDAAGPQFYKESRNYVKRHGKIKVGHSCHTSAGRLKYKCVIHTVGPRWKDYGKSVRLERCSEGLRLAVESAVLEANNCGMASVAIPAISSGIYGVPHNVCVTQYALGVIGACSQLERQQKVSLQEIHFVDKNDTLINMMKNTFQEFLSMEDEAEYPNFPGLQDSHSPSSKYEEISSPYEVDNIPHGRLDRPSSPSPKDTPMFDGKAGSSPSGIYNFPNGRWGRPVSPSPQHIPRFDDGPGNDRDQDSPQTTKRTNEPSSDTAAQQDNRSDVYPYSGTTIEHEVFKYIYSLSESVEIQVYNADILDTNVDGLVFGEDKDLQTKSRIGRAIRDIDKNSFDKEVEKVKTKKLKIGNVFGLQLKHVRQRVIFLLVMPSWGAPGTTHGDCINGLRKCVVNVLNKAAENGLWSIAMPVLGTGNTGAPVGEAANTIIEKIKEYFLTANKSCPLKQVHLVSKDEDTVTTIKTIMDGKMLKKREMHDILLAIGNQRPKPDARKPLSVGGGSMFATLTHDKEQLTCDICKNNITRHKIEVLPKCKHVFHKTCIDNQFEHTPVCPTCGAVYGVIYGNQPGNGKMNVKRWNPPGLQDYANAGYFEITYSFKDGIQTEGHPHPGSRYEGTSRTAYLPDTKRGRLILEMLKIAFERRLTFTIGQSRTTGKNNVVIWNDIHHKTSMSGGPQSYGYPDSGYFDRVIKELKAKGITPKDVKK